MGGPECGDILYWNAEGYNLDHSDSLSTTLAKRIPLYHLFSLLPAMASKLAIKQSASSQVDFVPTVAVLGGVRMPRECEGAPVYQILTEEILNH